MKLSAYLGLPCLLVALSSHAAVTTHYDQIADTLDGFLVETPTAGASVVIEQSFVPSFARLNFVELNVAVEPEAVQRWATVSVWHGELQVASSSGLLTPKNCTSDQLPLSCPTANNNGTVGVRVSLDAELVPGELYTIKLESTDPLILGLDNSYAQGQLSVNGVVRVGEDLWFKTGFVASVQPFDGERYWATGQVADIIELDAGATPLGIAVGDPVKFEFSLPASGAFIAAEPQVAVYAAEHALHAQIWIKDQLLMAQGSLIGIADNLPDGNNGQDLVTTRLSHVGYSDLPLGKQSFEIDIAFIDDSASVLSSTDFPTLEQVLLFGGKRMLIKAIDATSLTANGAERLDAGYILIVDFNAPVAATMPSYLDRFYVQATDTAFELSGRSGVAHEWFVGDELLGFEQSLLLPFAGSSPTKVKHRVTLAEQSRAKTVTLAGPTAAGLPYFPQHVVQLIDDNADGSADRFIHNPTSVKIGRDNSGIYSAQLYTTTPDWFAPLSVRMEIISAPNNPLSLVIGEGYYADYTNLEVADAPSTIGTGVINPAATGESQVLLQPELFKYITSAETRFFIHGASLVDAIAEFKVNVDSGFIWQEVSLTSSSSSPASSSSVSVSSLSSVSSSLSSSVASSSSSEVLSSSSALSSSSEAASSIDIASSSSSSPSSSSAVQSSSLQVSSSSSESSVAVSSFSSSSWVASSSSAAPSSSSVSSFVVSSSSAQSSSVLASSSSSAQSSVSSAASSSSSAAKPAMCSFVVNSQWPQGFVASIRIKNLSSAPIQGWQVNWSFTDGSRVVSSWNAKLIGTNPYHASNLSWNSTIQPGQTVEFGIQGKKNGGRLAVPPVTGAICQ